MERVVTVAQILKLKGPGMQLQNIGKLWGWISAKSAEAES